MCGRFTQNYTWDEDYAFLKVFGTPRNLCLHYNIAPTTNVDVIRIDREGRRELVSMRWGLVPYFWKKSLKEVPATFNARAETIAEKPMFRDSFKGQDRRAVGGREQMRLLAVRLICPLEKPTRGNDAAPALSPGSGIAGSIRARRKKSY